MLAIKVQETECCRIKKSKNGKETAAVSCSFPFLTRHGGIATLGASEIGNVTSESDF
jgi:hypothetical protein